LSKQVKLIGGEGEIEAEFYMQT